MDKPAQQRLYYISGDTLIDAATDKPAEHQLKKKSKFKQRFAVVWRIGADVLSQDKLTKQGYRLFFYLLQYMKYGNDVLLSQTEVAKALNMTQPRCSLAFKQLVDQKILIKRKKVGREAVYRMNPTIAWKGNADELEDAKSELFSDFVKQASGIKH